MKSIKKENGAITIITLVTILFIVSFLISSYIIAANKVRTEKDMVTETKRIYESEYTMEELYDSVKENSAKPSEWTQNGINITKGNVKLEVGQEVTGYTSNSAEAASWFVLGAENGKLLITTNTNVEDIKIAIETYVNEIDNLNEAGEKYKDNTMAESARSINVEDINRVTGYEPDTAKVGEVGTLRQWKNTVTYKKNLDNGDLYYKGTIYPTDWTLATRSDAFMYRDEEKTGWNYLKNGESLDVTFDLYFYYPQTLSTSTSTDTTIDGSEKAYDLLFTGTEKLNGEGDYWLASECCDLSDYYVTWNVRCVRANRVQSLPIRSHFGVRGLLAVAGCDQ